MSRAHSHKCVTCGCTYECDATLFRNHDGFPEIACTSYDRDEFRQCVDCFEASELEVSDEDATAALEQAAQRARDRVEPK